MVSVTSMKIHFFTYHGGPFSSYDYLVKSQLLQWNSFTVLLLNAFYEPFAKSFLDLCLIQSTVSPCQPWFSPFFQFLDGFHYEM